MKKLTAYIATILISSPLFAAKISDSQLELGRESATDNKEILFNIGEGTGNPKIRANYSTKKLEFSNDGTNFSEFGTGEGAMGYNIIENPGFESDLTNWTNTGSGSLSVDTDAADVYQGLKSGLWDAAAANDILASEAVTIPGGLRGNLCSVEVQYKGGDDNLKLQAFDGTNVLAEVALEASANFSKAMVTFTCPSSGTLQGRLIASADAAAVNVDNTVVGKSADIIGLITPFELETKTLSAAVSTTQVISDLSFTGLETGLVYEITLNGQASCSASSQFVIQIIDGSFGTGTIIAQETFQRDGGFALSSVSLSATRELQNSNVDIRYVSIGGGCTLSASYPTSITLKKLTSSKNTVQRVETSAWHVDVNFDGTFVNNGTSNDSTSNLPSSSVLAISENKGSIDAKIMCDGAVPGTTTCPSSNELPGIAFNSPRAGAAYVCVTGLFKIFEGSGTTDLYQFFRPYQVSTNGSVDSGLLGTNWSSIASLNNTSFVFRKDIEPYGGISTVNNEDPFTICGIANLTAGENGFVLAERTAINTGTPSGNEMAVLNWTVFPIEQQLPQALLISPEPAGEVATFAMNTCPTGWLKADGSAINRTANSRLFDAIGTTFGVGDGSTTFNLPDMRGEFARGFDDGRGVDSGRVFGSAQTDAFDSHTHVLRAREWSGSGTTDFGSTLDFRPRAATGGVDLSGINGSGVSSQDTSTTATGDSETRPRNVALLYCIRK